MADSEISKSFVGRAYELEILRKSLLGGQSRTVVISGPRGIGKTALGYVFSDLHHAEFPGGVSRLHANPMEPLDILVSSTFVDQTKASLIIIDDVDERPNSTVLKEVNKLRQIFPNAGIILTTGGDPTVLQGDTAIRLGGLSSDLMRNMIEQRASLSADACVPKELLDLLQGHVLAGKIAADSMLAQGLTPRELLRRLHAFTASGIYDPSGLPLLAGASQTQIISDITTVSDEFLTKLHDSPNLWYDLSPRDFEVVVAEILYRLGYDITLTPASKDGGKDIYAAKKSDLGSFLYVVECKRYAPDNTIGVGLIRQLNGVVEAERATAGILATTSFFTKDAKEFQTTVANRMSLKDYLGLQDWLARLQNPKV
ncbi:restriction system protein [Prosthecobacter fusiformis]|uniref:Restriction system protein n=1 Tax=Prosthecobacter fusiformis TaxID=48464 RepID=A0A4R7RWL1_9BACT|nr:restriction endonuclease [Prosthecobacter fusiformis]TDU69418.1 restriction system protein [Prosthecobacter fusiformis]